MSTLSLLLVSPLSQHYLHFLGLMRSCHCVTLCVCLVTPPSLRTRENIYSSSKTTTRRIMHFAKCMCYVTCHCLTVTPPESGSESWCYSYNLHPSVSFNKICKNRKDDAMQVHFRLLLIFFLTLVSKLPPYSSRLNPAQGPVAWCLQWPGTRHSLNFPRSSDS